MKNRFLVLLSLALAFVACSKQPAEPEAVKVTSVSLSSNDLTVFKDSSSVLVATVLPENATDKTVTWTSDDTAVASVDQSGRVTGVAAGSTKVKAVTVDGGFSAECQVYVTTENIPVKKIEADPDELIVRIGKEAKMNIAFTPANATDKSLVFSIPERFQKYATIDSETGVITGISEGKLTATAKTPDGKLSAKCAVTVTYENLPWVDGYPQGVKVHTFTDDLGGGLTCKGAWAEVDFSANFALRFNSLQSGAKTLIGVDEYDKVDWFDEFPEKNGKPVLLTNAGFFYLNTWVSPSRYETSSAIITDGALVGVGATTTGISGYTGNYYPVRSALCQHNDGTFSVEWIYVVDNTKVYTYPSALGQNDQTGTFFPTAECPTEKPQANTPGAKKLTDGKNLMQGGPRLVQNGVNVAWDNTWAELLNGTVTNASAGDSYRTARTAWGVTAEGHLILLVCGGDGRNGKNPAGFNMGELADKMIEIGCVDAVNFDGGGSSQMVGPDGKSIVSQIGSMRALPSIMAISEIQYD